MPQEFDVVCLGGGVAGEALAAGLRDTGLTLAVVERELVGGSARNWGCMPSKTLLRSGETLSEADRARLLAASRVDWTSTSQGLHARAADGSQPRRRRPAAAMEATGARLFRGEGRLTDLRTVTAGREQLIARRAVVIANGSTPAIPPIPGLDTVDFWTNRQAAIQVSCRRRWRYWARVPLAWNWAGLRTPRLRGDLIEAGPTFLGLEEPEAGTALRPHLEADGMTLLIGDHVSPSNGNSRSPRPTVRR